MRLARWLAGVGEGGGAGACLEDSEEGFSETLLSSNDSDAYKRLGRMYNTCKYMYVMYMYMYM